MIWKFFKCSLVAVAIVATFPLGVLAAVFGISGWAIYRVLTDPLEFAETAFG